MSSINSTTRPSTFYKRVLVVGGFALSSGMALSAFAAGLSATDKDFIMKAADSGNTEVASSKVAQSKSSSAPVKSFADSMINDHTAVNEQLKTLAAAKGVTVPTEPSAPHQEKISQLQKLQGAEFDKKYVAEIGVTAHKEAVALFEKAQNTLNDKDLKAFAVKTLPALKHHLQMAQEMNQKVAAK